ncbi:MAG: sigma-70 family RNA polymerase sigma factor [Isosphaeraceae bacterium]
MVRASRKVRRIGLTRERSDLAERYYPMAASMSRPYQLAWPQARDEFQSAAGLALVIAAERYDPERNVAFPLYAARRIEGALRDVHRKLEDRTRNDPYFGPEPPSRPRHRNPNDWPSGDLRKMLDERPSAPAIDEVDAFEARISGLPAPYARVCRALFLHGLTLVETARALGLSQPRVAQLRDQALRRLRKGNGRAPRRWPSPRQEPPWPKRSARSMEEPTPVAAAYSGMVPERPAPLEPTHTLLHHGSECSCSS